MFSFFHDIVRASDQISSPFALSSDKIYAVPFEFFLALVECIENTSLDSDDVPSATSFVAENVEDFMAKLSDQFYNWKNLKMRFLATLFGSYRNRSKL